MSSKEARDFAAQQNAAERKEREKNERAHAKFTLAELGRKGAQPFARARQRIGRPHGPSTAGSSFRTKAPQKAFMSPVENNAETTSFRRC